MSKKKDTPQCPECGCSSNCLEIVIIKAMEGCATCNVILKEYNEWRGVKK